MCGEKIRVNPRTQAKVKENMIKDAVCYILHKDHVMTISWGERTHHLSRQETITLPRLCRKLSPKELWNGYAKRIFETFGKKSDKNQIGRSSFYYLVTHLTCSNKVIVRAVEYVQALLVAEPITVLQDIIDSLVHPSKKEMMT